MVPSNSSVSNQLRYLIYYHIDNNLLQNALFFAERYTIYDQRNSESEYLLSLCYLRLGDNASAYEYSKSAGLRGVHLGCAYVFAQACLALERYKEGITALEKSRELWSGKNNFGKHTPSSRQPLADAAAVSCLLGKLYNGWDNKSKAICYFEDALRLNPFIWDAFVSLCDMGVNIRVTSIFKMNPEIESILRNSSYDHSERNPHQRDFKSLSIPNPDHKRNSARAKSNINDGVDPFSSAPGRGFADGPFGTLNIPQKICESDPALPIPPSGIRGTSLETLETPTGSNACIETTVSHDRRDLFNAYLAEPPQAPLRKPRTGASLGIDLCMDAPKMPRGLTRRVQKSQDLTEEAPAIHSLKLNSITAPPVGERKRTISGQVIPRQGPEDIAAPQRRSVRLFQKQPTSNKSSSSTLPKIGVPDRELKKAKPPASRTMRAGTGTTTIGRQASGNRKPVEEALDPDQQEASNRIRKCITSNITQRSSDTDASKQEEAIKSLLELLKTLGTGYYALSKFQCSEALKIYNSLPRTHRESPWVMAQIGRALYEQAAYPEAEKIYKRLRHVAPTRFEDMEIFSTILWHLKRETDLAFLAHELIDASWNSPQAWCALGNSWSLARDHEQALRCFKRATQLNPKFAYAFTLQGHEHVANEEYDKALVSYRLGMAADKRHYNAWYGVGRVFEKLGSYEKAFVHYTSASLINPTNAVLICCIGTVLEKQKQPRQALQYFTKAIELAPRSALTRFKKARTLMGISEYQAALAELLVLKNIAPEEAMVHFLLGKLYKGLKEKGLAVRHFTIALNLDPKASQQIKEAIESLEDENEDEKSYMSC